MLVAQQAAEANELELITAELRGLFEQGSSSGSSSPKEALDIAEYWESQQYGEADRDTEVANQEAEPSASSSSWWGWVGPCAAAEIGLWPVDSPLP